MAVVEGGGLSALQEFPIIKVKQLFHGLIDQFCGLKAVSYGDFEQLLTMPEWWLLKEKCNLLIAEIAKHPSSQNDVLRELEGLPVELTQAVRDCIDSRSEDIRQKLLNDVCSLNRSHLSDFDWQLKLVMGSDKMANMHKPLACVQMLIQEPSGQKQVTLEMTKEELSAFISTLENANKAISQLIT